MTDTTYIATQTIHDIQNVSDSFTVKDIVFIIIAIVNIAILGLTAWYVKKSPIEAVNTAELLQTNRNDADKKYQNKFHVLISILGRRHALGFDENFVISINMVPIVFYDNKDILSKYNIFIDGQKSTPMELTETVLRPLLNDLIVAISRDMGYSHVDNSLINNAFYPESSQNRHNYDDYLCSDYLKERDLKLRANPTVQIP